MEVEVQKTHKSNHERPKSFRIYLQNELLRRCRNNPNYSLRSFAKALQINPSSLSRILSGKEKYQIKIKNKIGLALGLTPKELGQLSTKALSKNIENNFEQDFNQLSEDTFSIISDWYHYAIMELVQLKDFKSDPKWVARALGITVSEVNVATERLMRLKLLSKDKKGQWINSLGNNTNAEGPMKAVALRKLQKQVLEMALKALEEIPLEFRDQSSMTMAIDLKRLPEAIEKITKFRREMSSFFEKDLNKNEVYHLGISFYPVTKFATNLISKEK